MKIIPLTRGYSVIVDDEDFELLSQKKWHSCNCGNHVYARTNEKVNGKFVGVFMHRLLTNAPNGMDVDHKNRNTLDNRKENLRICTRSENMQNSVGKLERNLKYKGVYRTREGRYASRIYHNYKKTHIGVYDTIEEAAEAYNQRAIEIFGEFARLNFNPCQT